MRRTRRGYRRPSVEPRSRLPKGVLTFWTRARRLLWSWWPWALVSIWAIGDAEWGWAIGGGAMALVSYLLAPPAPPPRFGLDHEFSIDSPEFVGTVAGASGSPFLEGNTLELLNNGDAFYPPMLAAIKGAEHSITIEAYIYWAGEIGAAFAEALAERAKAGCPVKILLDAIGSASIGSEILDVLEAGGCQVAWYNPIRWYTLGRFNNRTHRKSLIIDGDVAFTGGAGIADHWRGNARGPDEWRDMQIRLEGPAVVPLQTGFAHNWQQTTGELLSGDAYYPVIDSRGPLAVQTLLSSPETGAASVLTMYYLSIVCARESIFIANPYFVPDPVAIETLIEAKQRGVDVRIMVSGIRNDNWLARHNSVRLFGRLLAAGIEIQEFNRTMLHQKTMVVDGRWLTVGTTNFDNRSFAHNEESNVCCVDRPLAGQLHNIFLDDLNGSERVTIERWQKRGIWTRAQEVIAAVLQEQA
ncbi:MAG TPA: phospholipase D-like domain-containing protein [Vicinamibacterales bacterium]|nr:phospholipase D-like domain-containing protein [Vicinamibacterales bacterium]